jgi:hypothetical protein
MTSFTTPIDKGTTPNEKTKKSADEPKDQLAAVVETSTTPTRSMSEEKVNDDDEEIQEATEGTRAKGRQATRTGTDGGDRNQVEPEEVPEGHREPAAKNLNSEFTTVTSKKTKPTASNQATITNPYKKAPPKAAAAKDDTHSGRGGRGTQDAPRKQAPASTKVTQETSPHAARKGNQSGREVEILKKVAEEQNAAKEAKLQAAKKKLAAILKQRKQAEPKPPEQQNQELQKQKEKKKSVGFKAPERPAGSTLTYPPHGLSLEPARNTAVMINLKFHIEASKTPTTALVTQVKEFVEAAQDVDPTFIIHRWQASEPDQIFTDCITEPDQVMHDVKGLRNFFPEIKSWSIGGWHWTKALVAFDNLSNVQELRNKMSAFLEMNRMDLNETELQGATYPVEAGWLMYSLRTMDVNMHKKELEAAIDCSVGLRWHKVKPASKWNGEGDRAPEAWALHVIVDDKFKQFSIVKIKRLYAKRNRYRQSTPLGVRMRFITHIDRLHDQASRLTYITAISRQRAFERNGCMMMTLRDVKTMDKSMLTHLHNPNTGTHQRLPNLLGKSVDLENQEQYTEEEMNRTAPMDIRNILMNLRSTTDGKQLFHSIDKDNQFGGFIVYVIKTREKEASAHIEGVIPMLRYYYGDTFDKHFPGHTLTTQNSLEWDPTKRCVKSHLDMEVQDTFEFDDDYNVMGNPEEAILEEQLLREVQNTPDQVIVLDCADPDGDDSFASMHSNKSLNSIGEISEVASWAPNFVPDVESGQKKRIPTQTNQGKTKKAKIENSSTTSRTAINLDSPTTTKETVVTDSPATLSQLQYFKDALQATLGTKGFQEVVQEFDDNRPQEEVMAMLRSIELTNPQILLPIQVADMEQSEDPGSDRPDDEEDDEAKDDEEDDEEDDEAEHEGDHPIETMSESEASDGHISNFEDDEGGDPDTDTEHSVDHANQRSMCVDSQSGGSEPGEDAMSDTNDQGSTSSTDETEIKQEKETNQPTTDINQTAESRVVLPSPTDTAIDSGRDG